MHKKDLINSYINIKCVKIQLTFLNNFFLLKYDMKKILYLHYLKNYISNLTLTNSFLKNIYLKLTFLQARNFYIFLKLSDSKNFRIFLLF